jgi:hypothetical protein
VRQTVFYSSSGKPAVNMKFRIEPPGGQQISVDTAKRITKYFGKEVSRAAITLGTRRSLERKSASLSAHHGNRGRGVKGNSIGFVVNGLAVVAMADVLRQGPASQLQLDHTATTSNLGDSH